MTRPEDSPPDLHAGFQIDRWTVHPEQNRLSGPDGERHLNSRAMDVLLHLAERAGEVVSREDFSQSVWAKAVVTDDSLTWCISELRRQLGDQAANPHYIETIPKRGYRLIAPVKPLSLVGAEADGSNGEIEPRRMSSAKIAAAVGLALLAGLVAVAWLVLPERQPLPVASHSLAVLPFERFAIDGPDVFSEGLHHDLLTRLSHIEDLRVISRTSVKRYRDTILPIKDIAAELDVAWIVEGAVQQVGDEIQLNAQLIDTRTDSHVWARTYRRVLTVENLFAIQQDIVEDIAESLTASLTRAEVLRMDTVPTRDLDSYTLYIQGRTHLDARTEDGMNQALIFFRDALSRDPEYALAWVGLTDALALLHDYGYRQAGEVLPEAEEAIERALALEPDLAEAHASLGLLHSTQRRGPAAMNALEQATRLRPNYAEAHNWLAWNALVLGMPTQALESAEKAVSINPLSPEATSNLIFSRTVNGQINQALSEAARIERLGLSYSTDRFYKGLALYQSGRFEQAVEILEGLDAAWADGGPQAVLAMSHVALGQIDNVRELLGVLEEMEDEFSQALVLAALGESEAARQKLSEIRQWGYWPALAMHHFQDSLLAEPATLEEFAAARSDMRRAFGL